LSPCARVLIVDRSGESREVLRSLLVRRGAEVLEAREARQGVDMTERHRPDMVVLDADSPCWATSDSEAQLAAAAARNDIPIVVLGAIKRGASPLAAAEFVAKPYHYAALIRRIEELLGN
jgi:DNA-binding response OmpR family regulator